MMDKKRNFYTQDSDEMATVVESMHNIVRSLNLGTVYYGEWIDLVPDEADMDDFKFIAEDEELLSAVITRFRNIVSKYIK